jgi:ABC-type Na+ efflux pump permease subunit
MRAIRSPTRNPATSDPGSLTGQRPQRGRRLVPCKDTWPQWAAILLLLGGFAFLGWHWHQLTFPQNLLFCGLLLVLFCTFFRHGWVRLCGPLVYFDLVRAARRSRYPLLRAYVYFVLINLIVGGMLWYLNDTMTLQMPMNEAARVAEYLAYFFLSGQLLLMVLVTPGYTASAIADEKERRTLEALLVTDLSNQEIILSKLIVRVGNLLLMLMTGLPILMLLHFMGGVDAALALGSFAATMLTTASLAALGLVNSVCSRRPRDAIFYTYVELVAYLIVSGLSRSLYSTRFITATFSLGPVSLSAADLVDGFSAANPIHLLSRQIQAVAGGKSIVRAATEALGDYGLAHLLLTLAFTAWATLRLRAVFVKQTYGTQVASVRRRLWKRPQVGTWPMIWKELAVDRGFHFRWFGRGLLGVLFVGSFALLGLVLFSVAAMPESLYAVGYWSRNMGALVACLLLVGVAVRAAGSISGERERQTLDSLLSTPTSPTAILFAKWLGSIASVLWGWFWLAGIWEIGILWGDLDVVSLPLLFAAWFIYAGLLAVLGLWFSLTSRTTLHATMYTLFSTGALGISFLLLPFFGFSPIWNPSPGSWAGWLRKFLLGIAPPVAFGSLLPVDTDITGRWAGKENWELPFAILGLVCWLTATVIFWFITHFCFARLTVRQRQKSNES